MFGFPWSLITLESVTTWSVCCFRFIFDTFAIFPADQPASLCVHRGAYGRGTSGSSELTVARRPHAVSSSSGNVKVTKTSSETKCGTRDIRLVLIIRPRRLSRFCAELLLEHGSNVFCPPVFVSTLCCCAKWLHTCSQKHSRLYSLLLYAAGQIELYQIKLFGPFCCAVGKC